MTNKNKLLLWTMLTVLMLVGLNWAATISGKIHYQGTSAGMIRVRAYSSSSFVCAGDPIVCNAAGIYDYSIVNAALTVGNVYRLGAFLDVNGNIKPDIDEPQGEVAVNLLLDPTTEQNIILSIPSNRGAIQGAISYGVVVNPSEVKVYVSTMSNYDPQFIPSVPIVVTAANSAGGGYGYLARELPAGAYFLYAYIDQNNNGYEPGEPRVVYTGTVFVCGGKITTGINMTIPTDVLVSHTVRGKIREFVAGQYNLVGGVTVNLYDSNGSWDPSKFTLIASTESTAVPLVGDGDYNYEFTGIYPSSSSYNYVIKARKDKLVAQPRDLYFQFSSQLLTWDITMENAPVLNLSAEGVDNGIDGVNSSTDTVTITPDNDGVTDFAQINFTVNASTTNFWGAQARVIVDTNRDAIYAPFDWSIIQWDSQGNPMHNGQKITWDELNNLQAKSDWSFDYWLSQNDIVDDDSDGVGQKSVEVSWEGRDSRWNVLPNATYNVCIQLGYDLRDTFNSSSTVHIQVYTQGISGQVYYEANGSKIPVAGARVEAGGINSWGQAFTDAAGLYVIGGLKEGAYNVRVEAKGYSGDEKQNVPSGASGVDLILSPGGLVSGDVRLPSAYTGKVDSWGNTIQQLWGSVEAWDQTTGKRGFTNFQISLGTDTVSYSLTLAPGTYRIQAQVQGYVVAVSTGIVINSYGTTLDFVLGEAVKVQGWVAVPQDTVLTTPLQVNVNARSENNRNFGWGGTQILPGHTSAQFEIDNLAPDDTPDYAKDNTYELRFSARGYADCISTGVVVGTTAKVLSEVISFTKGETIGGTITFNGDTNALSLGSNYGSAVYIWLSIYGRKTNHWTGMQVAIPKSSTGCVTTYEIAGLILGETYEVSSWTNGFELQGQPVTATAPKSDLDLLFNGYTGKISGQVTTAATTTTSITYSNVMVTTQLSWWGDQQKDPLTSRLDENGKFSVEGLGTGEYVVTVNEYEVMPSSNPPFFWQGKPSGTFASATERVQVANGATADVVLELNVPSSIAGFVTNNSSTTTLEGLRVQAIPQKMAWMGMKGSFAMNNALVSLQPVPGTNNKYEYLIGGLAADTYIVTPFHPNSDGEMDLSAERKIVGLGLDDHKTGIDFTLTDGYKVTGCIQRPQVDEYDHYYAVQLFQVGRDQEPVAMTQLRFSQDPVNTKSDRTQNFSFAHIASGDYTIKIWTNGDYKMEATKVTVTDHDMTVPTIILGKGATIKGYLVDAETGEAVSAKQGAVVRCEARPWVEGSWQETRSDTFSGGGENPLKINEQSGLFQLPNLPAGNYLMRVEFGTSFDPKAAAETQTSKNYAATMIAGIAVPDSTDAVDVGTIKLKVGKTIGGTVTDINGSPLANILMIAQPSVSKGESVRLEAKTDAAGNYSLRGVNPDINRWQVQAAARGNWMEMRPSRYGEVLKDNITPGATAVNFVLVEAKARVNGKLVPPNGVELGLPYSGENLPCAVVLFQRAGLIYDDPMGGVEIVSAPDGRFEVSGLVPGGYIIKIMSKGLATKVLEKIIVEGANNLGNISLEKGGSVSGTIVDQQGSKVSTSLLSMAVAIEEANFGLTFGVLDTNDVSKEVNGYQVTGLVPGKDYRIVLGAQDGGDDEIFVSSTTVRISSVEEAATLNLVYEEQAPAFVVQVLKVSTGTVVSDNKFKIKVFSTKIIADTDAALVLTTTGKGTFNDADGVETRLISADKQNIEGTYSAGEVNGSLEPSFTLIVTAKDLKLNGATAQYMVNTGMRTQNQGRINPLLGGTVKIGEGDSSSLYVPSGAPDVASSTETVITTVASVDAGDTIKNSPRLASEYYSFVLPTISYANTPGEVKSDVYNMDMKLVSGVVATVRSGRTVKVGCEYENVSADQIDKLDLCYYDETNDLWVKETTNRVVDSTNTMISVDVNHLTKFAVFVDVTAPSVPTNFSAFSLEGNKASLSWTAVSATDLAGYNIYRSTEDVAASYTKIASVAKTVTSYTDTGLEKAKTYYYKVSAYDDASTPNEGALSAAKSVIGAYQGPFRTYVYPNPWKLSTETTLHIRYFIPLKSGKVNVVIKIYNLVGELVREFNKGDQDSGQTYDELWDGKNADGEKVASGVYLYHIKAGDNEEIKKIGLIK